MTLGGETIPLKQILELMEAISGRRAPTFRLAAELPKLPLQCWNSPQIM